MLINQDFALTRAKCLGGSDIGAILGLSKWRSPVDVWMEKTGRYTQTLNSLPLRFGSFAESFIATEYEQATNTSLVIHEPAVIHPQYSYLQGHIDRFICSGLLFNDLGQLQASKVLECKTANVFSQSEWGDIGTDQVPMPYLVQCLWYLMLTGLEQADLAVLLGNADFRIYEIHRDLELEEMLLSKAVQFWENHVLADKPPPAKSETDLRTLFPKSVGKEVEASSGSCDLIKKLQELNQQIDHYENEISNIKQNIMNQMQEAEILTYQGQVLATWKSPKASTRLDAKKLEKEHPEIIQAYQMPVTNSRRLIIKELS